MFSQSVQASRASALEVEFSCDFIEVRPAVESVRDFLQEKAVGPEEVVGCELALAEACNNAIRYAPGSSRHLSIRVEAVCCDRRICLRVYDHTGGFDWPETPRLPEEDAESGRGIFLMTSLMDEVAYFRAGRDNVLLMIKQRSMPGEQKPASELSGDELTVRIAESEKIINDMAEELSFCYESLAAIFRHSPQHGASNSLEEFSRRLLNDLIQITSADWFVLRLVGQTPDVLKVFAVSEAHLRLTPLKLRHGLNAAESVEAEAATTRQNTWFDAGRPLSADDPLGKLKPGATGVVHPFFFGDRLMGTLTLGRNLSRVPFTAGQMNVVGTFSDFLAIQIVNAEFQEEMIRNRLTARELEIAREIQDSLLLKELPSLPGMHLTGFCESARQVGGDFYDVLKLSDHEMLLIIADVMGKGVPAAMFAAILRSLLRSLRQLATEPKRMLEEANRLLFEELSNVDMFITAEVVYVNAAARTLKVASAGHCPALICDGENHEVRAVSPEGMPLGILTDTLFLEETVPFPPGSLALIYTDGLAEAAASDGEQFGLARLSEWLKIVAGESASVDDLKHDLAARLVEYTGSQSMQDDQTFLILAS